MENDADRAVPPEALWVAAFEAFKAASGATDIGDIPGSGFDRAARMWDDFEEIVGHFAAQRGAK